MKRHVFDCGQRLEWMTLESNGAMPDEATAVAMVTGEVKSVGRSAQPESVVGGRASTTQAPVVQDCCKEAFVAARQNEDAAPGLGGTAPCEPQEFPAREPGIQELAGTGNSSSLFQVFEDVHHVI